MVTSKNSNEQCIWPLAAPGQSRTRKKGEVGTSAKRILSRKRRRDDLGDLLHDLDLALLIEAGARRGQGLALHHCCMDGHLRKSQISREIQGC